MANKATREVRLPGWNGSLVLRAEEGERGVWLGICRRGESEPAAGCHLDGEMLRQLMRSLRMLQRTEQR